jgi:thioredoxin-related protein
MFLVNSKKLKLSLMVIFVSLSMVWMADISAAGSPVSAKETLPQVTLKEGLNLSADGVEANKKQVPVLLFFSMKHCPFCIEVEEDYLKPILRNSDYDSKVVIRKIRIDSVGDMRDFTGKVRDIEEFSDDYNVSMVPTLILVDSQGNKVASSIIGIANSHYYSFELDKAIDLSTQKIRAIAKR